MSYGTIECEECFSVAAYPQGTRREQVMTFSSKTWCTKCVTAYECSNCGHEFEITLPEEQHLDTVDQMFLNELSSGFNVTGSSKSYRNRIGFSTSRHHYSSASTNTYAAKSRVSSITRNRRKKTASAKDIKTVAIEVFEVASGSITEINLEL